jgi:hypothetical protein
MNELDRYLDDLGERLDAARVPRRPWTPTVAVLATGVTALALALVLGLAGGGGGDRQRVVPGVGPAEAIAKARAALQLPVGQMLHMRIRTETPVHIGTEEPLRTSTEELWATAQPLRWRQSWTDSQGGTQESAFADGTTSSLDASSNRLKRITGFREDAPQARIRTLLGVFGGPDQPSEPSEDLRAALANGTLVDAGEQQVGGRRVRRLQSKGKDDPKTVLVLIYDVDPVTFAPVGGERIYYLPPGKGRPRREAGPAVRFTVERYEKLPIDSAQLRIATKPTTKVVELTRAEWMRRFRAVQRWERRCTKLRRHNPRADCGARPTAP